MSLPTAQLSSISSVNTYVPQTRPIRFVSHDGQPHTKRRRISSACRTCRKRKTRCSGEKPICKTCSDIGHTCLGYPESGPNEKKSTASAASDHVEEEDEPSTEPGPRPTGLMNGTDEALSYPNRPGRRTSSMGSSNPQVSVSDQGNLHRGRFREGSQTVKDDVQSLRNNHVVLGAAYPNKLPYFRYFGPTAIVPGFKQMVVQVKEHGQSTRGASFSGDSPSSGYGNPASTSPSMASGDARTSLEIPSYDPNDPVPISPLIAHLCETFFAHLGCNFAFLQRERFMRDLYEKKVEVILVDAVCAISARFSTHPLLTSPNGNAPRDSQASGIQTHKSEHGQVFAQRAMSAVNESFSCPHLAVVQACLLLAYEQFGSNRDSGLWVFLGLSIRMAQDLGMQKLEGIKYEGRVGPTPKTVKPGDASELNEKRREESYNSEMLCDTDDRQMIEERRANERERIDTFWAIYFLDRAISSGLGRPVTLRDEDIELSFPSQEEADPIPGWPAPFPALIRIVHLYGRVTDLVNNIRDVTHVTPETLKRLADMENDLTVIYQGLSPKLHFNPVNFQHYVKIGQGTNFILLHFWFHTFIVYLHQPTLLHSFDRRIQQLLPNNLQLSISSAKTIADILAFAELIDANSFIGNPFTSQPMYIAACAFLVQSATHAASNPPSRASTPSISPLSSTPSIACHGLYSLGDKALENGLKRVQGVDQRSPAKHTLLATVANQNYQRCYKSLKSLESYWAGAKYILTALDQKAEGILDPLLYTSEDVDGAVEVPRNEPAFTSPGWRRNLAFSTNSGVGIGSSAQYSNRKSIVPPLMEDPTSPMIDPSQAIGWSLTGTTNSANPNFSLLYQNSSASSMSPQPRDILQSRPLETAKATTKVAAKASPYLPASSHIPSYTPLRSNQQIHQPAFTGMGLSQLQSEYAPSPSNTATTSSTEMLLGLHAHYPPSSAYLTTNSANSMIPTDNRSLSSNSYGYSQLGIQPVSNRMDYVGNDGGVPSLTAPMSTHLGDMMIESQDIDMRSLDGDMMPYLEYLPADVMDYFDPHNSRMGQPR